MADDGYGFYIVLPSNVKSNYQTFQSSANSYQTTFPTSYDLKGGEWEMALTEVSYVNTIPTIVDESFTVNSAKLKSDAVSYTYDVEKVRYVPKAMREKLQKEQEAREEKRRKKEAEERAKQKEERKN